MVSSVKSRSLMEVSTHTVSKKMIGAFAGIMLVAGTYVVSLWDQGQLLFKGSLVIPSLLELVYFVLAWLFADSIYGQTERGARLVWLAPLAAGFYVAGNTLRYSYRSLNFYFPEGMPAFVLYMFEALLCVALSACVAAVCVAVSRRRNPAGANTALLSEKTGRPAFSAKVLPFCALSFAAAYLTVIVFVYLSGELAVYSPLSNDSRLWLESLLSFVCAVAIVCFVFRKKPLPLISKLFLTASVCFGVLYFALEGFILAAIVYWLMPAPDFLPELSRFLPDGSTALCAAGVCFASYLVLFCRRTRMEKGV